MTVAHVPGWLQIVSTASLMLAGVCAAFIAVDEIQRPQRMGIMNLVWPAW